MGKCMGNTVGRLHPSAGLTGGMALRELRNFLAQLDLGGLIFAIEDRVSGIILWS